MRKVRYFSIVIFLIALIVYGLMKWDSRVNSDSAGPVISMESESISISTADDESAILKGITAIDEKDGDVTASLIVESMSNFVEKGRRTATIAAFDSDNHVTKITREIIYTDYHSPRFALNAPLKFQKNVSDILTGLEATDLLDGSLTSNIKVSAEYSVQVDSTGEYPMVFTVSNSAGDVSELPVTVEIYDVSVENKLPQIELTDYIIYVKKGESVDPWNYVKQVNVGSESFIKGEDGILHNQLEEAELTSITAEDVVITTSADYNVAGVYEIIYQYEDGNRNQGSVRLIVVVE